MRNILVFVHLNIVLAFVAFSRVCAVSPPENSATNPVNKATEDQSLSLQSNLFIHRDGMRIVDGKGNPVVLKGVNLGGWLMWEGWIFGGGFISQSQIMNRLKSLVGEREAEKFQSGIYENFVTEADFREISRMGLNVARLPINHSLLEDDSRPYFYKDEGWRILDRALDWAEKYKIYIVLDLHGAPGGQNNGFISDPEFGNSLWKSAENKKRTVALWRAIAERYENRRIIAGYDLLNEPKPPKGQDLVSIYKDIIRAIRGVDRRHMLIVEGGDNARDFSMFDERLDENMAYSFHMYTWFGKKRESDRLELNYAEIARKHDVPLWCGEFGEDQPSEVGRLVNLYNDNSSVAGWSFWTWKKTVNRNPALVAVSSFKEWENLMKWTTHPLLNRKPSKTEAQTAISDFLDSVRMENNEINPRMADVLK